MFREHLIVFIRALLRRKMQYAMLNNAMFNMQYDNAVCLYKCINLSYIKIHLKLAMYRNISQ